MINTNKLAFEIWAGICTFDEQNKLTPETQKFIQDQIDKALKEEETTTGPSFKERVKQRMDMNDKLKQGPIKKPTIKSLIEEQHGLPLEIIKSTHFTYQGCLFEISKLDETIMDNANNRASVRVTIDNFSIEFQIHTELFYLDDLIPRLIQEINLIKQNRTKTANQ